MMPQTYLVRPTPAARVLISLTVGLFLGMSASPVVGSVTAVLVALLFSAFREPSKTSDDQISEQRQGEVVSFGYATQFCLPLLVGSIAGVFVRSYELLGPSPSWHIERLRAAGVSEAKAVDAVIAGLLEGKPLTSPVLFSTPNHGRSVSSFLEPTIFDVDQGTRDEYREAVLEIDGVMALAVRDCERELDRVLDFGELELVYWALYWSGE